MKLSFGERLILINQYRRFQTDEEPADYYDKAIAILEGGYEDHYDFVLQDVRKDVFPSHIAQEVREILDMFRQLQWVKEKYADDPVVQSPLYEFMGFDWNSNVEHCLYAKLLQKLGEFHELGDSLSAPSHSDNIEIYRCMVDAWKQLSNKGLQLTKNDVEAILDAPRAANLPMPEGGPQA